MNELTIRGNVTKDPEVRTARTSGRCVVTFAVAVNGRRWFDESKNEWVSEPSVFHNVVCFQDLADNAAQTLCKGMAVTISGEFIDDSYTPDGSDYPVHRIKFRANDVAVSLRRAIAMFTKNPRTNQGQDLAQPVA